MERRAIATEGRQARPTIRRRRFVSEPEQNWPQDAEAQRILVVGADPTQTLLLRRTLEVDGYEIADCGSGREAVLSLLEHTPDLLLVNAPLSDGSAVAFVHWLRKRPTSAHVVCFVIAPPSQREAIAALYEAGADMVITRPTELGLLSHKVTAALARHSRALLPDLSDAARA